MASTIHSKLQHMPQIPEYEIEIQYFVLYRLEGKLPDIFLDAYLYVRDYVMTYIENYNYKKNNQYIEDFIMNKYYELLKYNCDNEEILKDIMKEVKNG